VCAAAAMMKMDMWRVREEKKMIVVVTAALNLNLSAKE
jgi:hypothetical protein